MIKYFKKEILASSKSIEIGMKILISTHVFPTKKNKLINYVESIYEVLQTKTQTKIIWLVFQPDKFIEQNNEDGSILDMHDFKNAVELLQKVKPDCVFANNNSREPISNSLSIAANHMKIPLIVYYTNDNTPILDGGANMTYTKNASMLFRNFFADKVQTDTESDKVFMRRSRFFYYKNKFLFRTRRKIGVNYFKGVKLFIKDLIWYFLYKRPIANKLADLYLCSNEILYNFLLQIGIDECKISITGSPFWDKIYQKVKLREKYHKQQNDQNKEEK